MKQIESSTFTLITGASSGIGKALAESCAQRGMNLALIALPGIELRETVEYMHYTYGVKVFHLGIDLTQPAACELVVEWIHRHQLQVNMLINNAGIGCTGGFEKFSSDFYQRQIQLNVVALTLLTRLMINDLRQNSQSYILNLGSMSGFFFVPFKDVYAATKSFVITFSESLRHELKHTGIHVSVLCPGGVISNAETALRLSHHGWLAKASALTCEEVANEAINKLLRKKSIVIPGALNRLMMVLEKIVPAFITNKIVAAEFKKCAMAL
ncbi:MAG: SDR family NAD(P)-dependent oxidoreductase [Chitinophagales bacterium]